MSKIFGFSFSKQTGTSISEKRKAIKKVQTRGLAAHLKPGIDIVVGGSTGGGTNDGGSTVGGIEYEMYFSPSYNTITIDGVDQTSVTPEGFIYPVELTPDNIDPNNLVTLYITDPYPWEITVYADSTKLVAGTMNSSGLPFLWAPDVQGGGN